jgi:1-acyl-sn-glycerol-3-phosphate acyltransferase
MHQILVWWFFTIKGWKVEGSFPYHLKKSVIIVAPHTHNIDFFLGLAFRKKLHLEFVRFLGKKELFIPPFSWILKSLGGSPVDRSKNNNLVDQVVALFNKNESFHLALSPEGTRKKVATLKSGFYHIAKNAQVPIVMIGLDFSKRRIVFAAPFETSPDMVADKKKVIEFFTPFKGYVPAFGIDQNTEC